MLALAAHHARFRKDNRDFFLGAIAIRHDDVMVFAYNGHPHLPTPAHHCEARLARKLDYGATVYLVRLAKNGDWANSKPCHYCMKRLKSARVKKVFYTEGPNQWNSLEP